MTPSFQRSIVFWMVNTKTSVIDTQNISSCCLPTHQFVEFLISHAINLKDLYITMCTNTESTPGGLSKSSLMDNNGIIALW